MTTAEKPSSNPFLQQSNPSRCIALRGLRNGYIQLAPSKELTLYNALDAQILIAAQHWCCALESLGAKRVYWLTLSEVLPHLHIHLYPRWSDSEIKGLALFEARHTPEQPAWTEATEAALIEWAAQHDVFLPEGI